VYIRNLHSSLELGPELEEFLIGFPNDSIIVNIGSMAKKIDGVFNLDLNFRPHISVIADAHELPFGGNSLDGLVVKNVFEHLRDPVTVREELRRVIKPDGKIYAKVPFMQPFHAVPDDYQRYSRNGLREFFKEFRILDEGISVGPSSAISWLLREYLAILCSFNSRKKYNFFKSFFGFFTAPIKYLDVFFRNRDEAHRLASAFYLILQK